MSKKNYPQTQATAVNTIKLYSTCSIYFECQLDRIITKYMTLHVKLNLQLSSTVLSSTNVASYSQLPTQS